MVVGKKVCGTIFTSSFCWAVESLY